MGEFVYNLGRLERVELREAWRTEAGDFTPWLAQEQNIELLGEAVGIELEVEAQEKNVGPFRADILCKDTANGSWVLIENQLERTDHCHLGQLLTYAAGLQAVTIIWIASRFTEEHRAALDWLNKVTDDSILFFGLEVELWRIGKSPMAPKFNVVSAPNDWSKSVSGAQKAIDQGIQSETGQRYIDFWKRFAERITETKSSLRIPKPNADHWKNYSIGRSEFAVAPMILARDAWIGVQLTMYGDRAKQLYASLLAQKDIIESALGEPLVWRELPSHKESQIRLVRTDLDPKDRDHWTDISDWLINRTEKFLHLFRPIVRDLAVSDAVESPDTL
ncbi:MAG: DUF4268 domain-containing protein [Planctomycetota bacterium]